MTGFSASHEDLCPSRRDLPRALAAVGVRTIVGGVLVACGVDSGRESPSAEPSRARGNFAEPGSEAAEPSSSNASSPTVLAAASEVSVGPDPRGGGPRSASRGCATHGRTLRGLLHDLHPSGDGGQRVPGPGAGVSQSRQPVQRRGRLSQPGTRKGSPGDRGRPTGGRPAGLGLMRGHRARAGTPLIIVGLVLGLTGLTLFLVPDDRVTAEFGSVLNVPASDLPESARRDAISPPQPSTPPATPQTSAVTTPGFTPQRLLVEPLDVDALVVTTLVDTDGALVPPEDPAQLGWWRGVRPGEGEGSVVIAGHIDSRRFGQGPLARIVELKPGDRAVLTTAGGASADYVVRGIQTFPKESFPAADLFGTDGPERLVLVTCGGAFDRARGGWDSNVIAVLDPTPPA